MDALFGSAMPLAVRFFIAFLVVLALIGLTAWLVRRFGANRLGGATRGRQPRLAVIDAASVDGRRRLVLIRRDNIEHLLMIGGPTDVVIEPNIVRAAAASTREPARLAAEIGVRVPPPMESTFPQAPMSEPTSPPPPRPYRSAATEEPWHAPEPGARPRPADSLTGLAAELSAKLSMPAELTPPPPREREQVPRTTAAPPTAPAPPEPTSAPAQNDQNLAEMAQQLEAALRRAPAAEGRPPVTDALAVPPLPPKAPRPTARESKPRLEPKFEPPKFEPPKREPKFEPAKFENRPEPKLESKPEPTPEAPTAPEKRLYDNLEEEMASLLGRPPDKS
jgi:flagellar protein FliO/FliZ